MKLHEAAIEQLHQAVASTPDDFLSCQPLGRVFTKLHAVAAVLLIRPLVTEGLAKSQRERGYKEGRRLAKLGRYPEAIEQFQRVLAAAPDDARSYHELGRVYIKLGDHEAAAKYYWQAVRAAPGSYTSHHELGRTLMTLGNNEAAAEQFRQALVIEPRGHASYYELGRTLMRLEDYEGAAEELRQALAIEPRSRASRHELGRTLAYLGDYDAATKEFHQALSISPGKHTTHDELGRVRMKLKDYEGAVKHFRRALAIRPEAQGIQQRLGRALTELKGTTGRDRSLKGLRRVFARLRDAGRRRRERGGYKEGRRLAKLGRYPEAIEQFQRVLAAAPDDARSYHELGRVYIKLGDHEAAAKYYWQAVQAVPGKHASHHELGRTLMTLGDNEAAAEQFRQALVIEPRGHASYYELGRTLMRLEDYEGAAEELRQALAIEPRSHASRHELGRALGYLGDYEAAIEEFQQALSIDPGRPTTHRELGRVRMKLRDYEGAAEHFRRALAIEPGNPAIHQDLGRALGELGDDEAAAAHFREALSRAPRGEGSLKGLRRVLTRLRDAGRRRRERGYKEGRRLAKLGRYPEAIEQFQRILAAAPDDARSYHELGRVLLRLGKYEDAARRFRGAIVIRPESHAAHHDLGRALAYLGQNEAAIEQFRKALSISPDFYVSHHEWGQLLAKLGEYQTATQHLEQALAIAPGHSKSYYILSQIELQERSFRKSLLHLDQAIRLSPENASYRLQLAKVHFESGDIEAAMAACKKALQLDSTLTRAQEFLDKVSVYLEVHVGLVEPNVTVCMWCSNDTRNIERAVRSVLEQSYPKTSVVIGIGVSDSPVQERVERLRVDSRVRIVKVSGPPGRRWTELAQAAPGQWVGFLRSEDYLSESAIESLVEVITPRCAVVSCNTQETNEAGEPHGRVLSSSWPSSGSSHVEDTASRLPLFLLWKRELLDLYPDEFHEDERTRQEVAFHVGLTKYVKGTHVDEPLHYASPLNLRSHSTLPADVAERWHKYLENREKTVFLVSRHGYPPFGGGEHFLLSLIDVYRSLGYEPYIIGFKGNSEGEANGFRYIHIPLSARRIRKLVLEKKPDLIHTLAGTGYEILYAVSDLRVPVIYGTHFWRDLAHYSHMQHLFNGDGTLAAPRKDFHYILRNAAVVYSNSQFTQEIKEKHFGAITPVVYSLPADTHTSTSRPDGEGYVLLTNTREDKGFDLMLDIARRLPSVRFVAIAGQSSPVEAVAGVAKRGLQNVTVLERTDDMASVYRGARVVLVPSYAFVETFSRVVVEAHRFGIPVIGSNRGNVPYLLRESGVGLEENPDSWAQEIRRLYEDQEYYVRQSKLASENSVRYSFQQQYPKIAELVKCAKSPVLVGTGAGIGNIIQATPMIRKLAETLQQKVDVVINADFPGCGCLLAGSKYVNMVMPAGPDAVNKEYQMVFLAASFGDTIPAFSTRKLIVIRRKYPFSLCQQMHETEYNLLCLSGSGLGVEVGPNDHTRYFIGDFQYVNPRNKRVGLHAGAKGGVWANKRWPYFVELASRLKANGHEVVSFGGKEECVEGTLDLTGTPLRETIQNMMSCSYFVANDSGLMHVADALGIPLVALFGPTSVVKNGPLRDTSSVVALTTDCAPCQFGPRLQTCDCMKLLTVQQVWEALAGTLPREFPQLPQSSLTGVN